MVVRILLLAEETSSLEAVQVSRTVELDVDGPAWEDALVSAVGRHARETARCLAGQLAPAIPPTTPATTSTFVPLAQVLPVCG
ncbi:MAG: hypothetical protein FJ144_03695 [Deltaproteobacteria bacterium]|nr:hypothetical protein [Deltaproteobacteria bacterium]